MADTQIGTGGGIVSSGHSKAATVAFLSAGILVWISSAILLRTLAIMLPGQYGSYLSGDLVRHGIPFALGLGLFIFAQTNHGIRSWSEEVVAEIYKIVWPSRPEVVARTIGVCIMVLIAGFALGLMDVISGSFVDWLLHQDFYGIFS